MLVLVFGEAIREDASFFCPYTSLYLGSKHLPEGGEKSPVNITCQQGIDVPKKRMVILLLLPLDRGFPEAHLANVVRSSPGYTYAASPLMGASPYT